MIVKQHKIYRSDLIINNQIEMVKQINHCYQIHQKHFDGKDSTWSYSEYNFFALSSPSLIFNKLFYELKDLINDYVPHKIKWMQCWLNYHYPEEVLKWHNHGWDYHGYISIDPKNTRTVFREYEIKNEIGNIYIGPGNREHIVVVDEYYDTPRITLGFDVHVYQEDRLDFPSDSLSLIPL